MKVVVLTDAEHAMLVDFLDDFGDRLANDGCNDYDLDVYIPDLAERKKFVLAYHQFNEGRERPVDYDPEKDIPDLPNFCVVSLLRHKIESAE